MESTLNRVELLGRVTADAVTNYLEDGLSITKFQVSVGNKQVVEDPDVIGKEVLIACTIFGRPAMGAALSEGKRVLVIGSLSVYTSSRLADKKETRTEVVVDKLIFLDKPRRMTGTNDVVPPKLPKWKPKS